MAQVLVTESYLSDIAGAIRGKLKNENKYKPSQMGAAIQGIEGSSRNNTKIQICEGAGIDIKDGWIGPFVDFNTFFRPLNSSGSILMTDFSKPFEIGCRVKISNYYSKSMVIFGNEYNSFYRTPSIELQQNSKVIWCGLSTNGSSWGYNIEFGASDGISIGLNTVISIKAVWDGTNYTVTVNDGTHEVSKSVKPSSAPYYSSSNSTFEFGGINHSSDHCGKYLSIDLNHTYIKSEGVLTWGCEG